MNIAEAIQHLQRYPADLPVAFSLWMPDDVNYRAKNLGKTLTKDEINDVLDAINDKHDANIGINWDVIDFHIASFTEN